MPGAKQQVTFLLGAALFAFLSVSFARETAAKPGATRIRFARGHSQAAVRGTVVRGDRERYTIGARAGQRMRVSIRSVEKNAVFSIYVPGGGHTLPGTEAGKDARSWNGKLPASGDYLIEVGPTRGNATYTLTVSIR